MSYWDFIVFWIITFQSVIETWIIIILDYFNWSFYFYILIQFFLSLRHIKQLFSEGYIGPKMFLWYHLNLVFITQLLDLKIWFLVQKRLVIFNDSPTCKENNYPGIVDWNLESKLALSYFTSITNSPLCVLNLLITKFVVLLFL